ncbi:MAG: IS200/IS605 family transposase [Pirellulales bacterium]|nr:IS200/IS605 family transposase [Pirellulales bacterium]
MPQSFVSLHCHIIFSTKYRKPFLTAPVTPRLYEYIGGIVRNQIGCLIAAGGVADHIHLLVSFNKTMAVADAVRHIKSNSSGWIHDEFPKLDKFSWQKGYGAFAVSYSNLSRVRQYIAGQQEHHHVKTFKEEFLAFLKRHNMQYDERYIWD